MTEPENHAEEPTATPGEPDAGSIFGNLPKERPGARSPRRAANGEKPAPKRAAKTKPAAAKRSAKPKPTAPTAPPAPPAPREPLPPPSRSPRPQPAAREQPMRREGGNHANQIGGIEDLAWAGVTVAAQAATVGVKLASRALEAVRKSVDRP